MKFCFQSNSLKQESNLSFLTSLNIQETQQTCSKSSILEQIVKKNKKIRKIKTKQEKVKISDENPRNLIVPSPGLLIAFPKKMETANSLNTSFIIV